MAEAALVELQEAILTGQLEPGAPLSDITIDDLHDTYEARLALETLAVRRAAERFGDDDAVLARAHLDEHVGAHDRGEAREARAAHTAFHFSLYAASGSDWLLR